MQYIDNKLYILSSTNFDKPFSLVIRHHDLGGTDYEHICNLTIDHAQHLAHTNTADWLYGEPDWDVFFAKRDLKKAEMIAAKAKETLEKLEKKKDDVDMNKCHQSHILRGSDASSYDVVCTVCGKTDKLGSWGKLSYPCEGVKT